MTSAQILKLLASRHKDDVFIPECNTGPVQNRKSARIDAWAMKKSWANPMSIAYEIKVSRGDFLRDNKWQAYMECCNELYFVCPSGLIKPEEVPAGVGLLWVASTLNTLLTKRKASYVARELPENLYRYILMSRFTCHDERPESDAREHRLKWWREWLETKKENRRLGWYVRQEVAQHIHNTEEENRRLKEKMAGYDTIRATLKRMGFNNDVWTPSPDMVERRLLESQATFPAHFRIMLRDLERLTANARREIEEYENKLKAEPKAVEVPAP